MSETMEMAVAGEVRSITAITERSFFTKMSADRPSSRSASG